MRGISSPWFDNYDSRNFSRRPIYMRHSRINYFTLLFGGISVTTWLILLNVVFFVLILLFGFFNSQVCSDTICDIIALEPANFFEDFYFWTLLTSMFMHGSIGHLFVNMFVLFSLGGLCEKIIGRKRFLWFYLLSGLFAGLLYVFLAYFFGFGFGQKIFGSPFTPAVGASGAIFAIAGLFVMLTPKLKFYIIFLPFFSLPAYIMIPLILLVTWLVSSLTSLPVGNVAHLGGFLAGIIYGCYLKSKYKRKTKMISEIFCD